MADSITVVVQGRTAMQVQTRSGMTQVSLAMNRPTVTMEIVGGAPGPRGTDGVDGTMAFDPGDITLSFDNALI